MKKKYLFSLTVVLIFSLFYASTAIGIILTTTVQRIVIPYTAVSNGWWSGLAIHNQSAASETYIIYFYDIKGTYITGTSVTIPAYGIHKDTLQNYADDPNDINGNVSVYIQTDGQSYETFSAMLFMGNTASSQGFGFDTYQSEDFEVSPIF